MPDQNVDKWKQPGRVYLWRYLQNARNYPGWHLSADKAFCVGFADLIQRMLDAPYNCQKRIEITAPTKEILRVPNNQGGQAAFRSAAALILKHRKGDERNAFAEFAARADEVIVSADRQRLGLLGNCVSQIIEGRNDYAIEIGNTQLWFW